MPDDVKTEIMNYVNTFKGTYDLHEPYRNFQSSWLENFDAELTEKVNIEFECVRNERIYGDGECNEMVLDDFITSLENLFKD